MQYHKYLKEGLLIGSGAIESAHKDVLQQRLKLSGQRWTMKRIPTNGAAKSSIQKQTRTQNQTIMSKCGLKEICRTPFLFSQ